MPQNRFELWQRETRAGIFFERRSCRPPFEKKISPVRFLIILFCAFAWVCVSARASWAQTRSQQLQTSQDQFPDADRPIYAEALAYCRAHRTDTVLLSDDK